MLGAAVLPTLFFLVVAVSIYGWTHIMKNGPAPPETPPTGSEDVKDTRHRRFLNSPGELLLLIVAAAILVYAYALLQSKLH